MMIYPLVAEAPKVGNQKLRNHQKAARAPKTDPEAIPSLKLARDEDSSQRGGPNVLSKATQNQQNQ